MVTLANEFDIPGCLRAAAAIETDLAQLAATLTEAQFHAPPRTGGWSVDYCIEHLVLTGQAFLPKWDMALQEAARTECDDQDRFRYEWWQRRILLWVENPSRLKLKTALSFVPNSRRSLKETVDRFLAMHQDLMRRVTSSPGLDARQTKVQSPSMSWISYSLGFSFDLVLAHERRHLGQAWRVRRQLVYES